MEREILMFQIARNHSVDPDIVKGWNASKIQFAMLTHEIEGDKEAIRYG